MLCYARLIIVKTKKEKEKVRTIGHDVQLFIDFIEFREISNEMLEIHEYYGRYTFLYQTGLRYTISRKVRQTQ